MVIDQERCIGCDACTIACQIENKTSNFWINIRTQGGNKKDIPNGKYPNLELNFQPQLCNHCNRPPCVDACSSEALIRREDGIVILDKELCTGCEDCISACPYGVITFDNELNIAEKCNFCAHRIDKGLEPFCVICCEGQAMQFGDLNDKNSAISILISKRDTFQLKPEVGTDPSIYYCSPKLKRVL